MIRLDPEDFVPDAIPDKANVIAPPPLIFAGLLLAGWLLDRVWPARLPAEAAALWLGRGFILAGVLVAAGAILAMRRRNTPLDPRRPTTAIVTEGPYRFSRNPVYLSLILIFVGIGPDTDTPSILLLAPVFVAILHFGVIKREERYLEHKFGDAFLDYRFRVRRWL